jgi:virginiamycin B lyase
MELYLHSVVAPLCARRATGAALQGLWFGLLLLCVSAPASAQSVSFREYPIPTPASGLGFIVTGPDAALWFTERGGNKIGRITTSGELKEYAVPTPNSGLSDIASGPDGALWFVESGSNKIGRIATSGAITEYVVPTSGASPTRIAAGSDGALWFTEYAANKIGRINTSGAFIEYSVRNGTGPWGITPGPDQALWFAEANSRSIGRITTSGIVNEYPISPGIGGPNEITNGTDGALWFVSSPAGIGRITTSGVITLLGDSFNDITAGPDGLMWYTGFTGSGGVIGQFALSGPINSYNIPPPNSQGAQSFAITAGPDGAVWFTDYAANLIGRAALKAPSTPSINAGGIVPVDSTVNTIQPGEWVSIFGTNLASSTLTWNGNFATSLGGTSVTINGKAAYLSFVSSGQINVQAPDDTATGIVPVVVTTSSGSATSTVTLAQFGPSFLLLDAKHVAGIVVRSNGTGAYGGGTYDIIGPTGNSLGYPTVAAKPGDVVELFVLGLGPTNPAGLAGQAFPGPAPTTSAVNVLLNDNYVSVTPIFAGLSGAGLFQINLTVPAGLGTGDFSLVAAVGGVQTPAVVISLQDPSTGPGAPCANVGGNWNVSESGSYTEAIASPAETDSVTNPVSGNGTAVVAQTGCSIQYNPISEAGLIGSSLTPGQLASLARTGTVNGETVRVTGLLALVDTVGSAQAGFTVTNVSSNVLNGNGQVAGNPAVMTLNETGAFVASGTYSIRGQTVRSRR